MSIDDLTQIKEELKTIRTYQEAIIEYFNIGRTSPRRRVDIAEQARRTIIELGERKRKKGIK